MDTMRLPLKRVVGAQTPAPLRDDATGYIFIDRSIDAIDLLTKLQAGGDPIPQEILQFESTRCFDLFSINVGVELPSGAKRIIDLELTFNILANLPPGAVLNIDDGSPKDEWKPMNIDVSTKIDVTLAWQQIEQFIAQFIPKSSSGKLAGQPSGAPAPSDQNAATVLFTWEWKPYLSTIYRSIGGLQAYWKFQPEPGYGLDGTHTMAIALRRSTSIHSYSIQLTAAKFTADYGWLGGQADFTANYLANIPVNTVPAGQT